MKRKSISFKSFRRTSTRNFSTKNFSVVCLVAWPLSESEAGVEGGWGGVVFYIYFVFHLKASMLGTSRNVHLLL